MKDAMLIIHFLALAMVLGAVFALLFLNMAKSSIDNMRNEQALGNAMILCKMGNYGLLLSFVSGGYLMTPYWANLSIMPLLTAKLILFLVLAALFGIMTGKTRKITQAESQISMSSINNLIKLVSLVAVILVVLAVRVFH